MSRLLLALAAGGVLCLAFPAYGFWVLAPVGVALLALATQGVGWRAGFGLGVVTGLAFFLPTLSWSGIVVGTLPWLALALLQALFVGVAGLTSALGQRTGVSPLVTALSWVLSEALRDRVPYGGFPWVRLAFSQADSPMGRLASVAGAPGVTFVVALAGGLLAVAISYAVRRRRPTRGAAAAIGAVAVVLAGLLVRLPVDGPTARVLAVQGNVPRAGLDFNAERRQVLDNHVSTTLAALDAARAAGEPAPELVVWPENSSDIDPTRNPDAHEQIMRATDAAGVPLIIGALLYEPAPLISNVTLMYLPGQGLVQTYVKQHPVPFAEYIPSRAFYRMFSSAVDLLRVDQAAGSEPGIFHVGTPSGQQIVAGASICFEVAYDDLVRANVLAGSNLLLVQTNNATFGYSAESEQQLAISRIRAIEHGRSVVHVSTVGVSGLILADGTVHEQTSLFQAAALADDLPLRDSRTLATLIGPWPEYGACLALLVLLVSRNRPRANVAHTQARGRRGSDERSPQ
ncbi:MAG: apolipoprotein N-acyltransferase [Dermatophilaceae bacterium]